MTKTKISATVIADSKNEFGQRITSFIVKFPRIILAEFNTHRMFSRNSASSRAIPFEKMLKLVQEDPFIPIAWQKDHKGMQGTEYINASEKQKGRVMTGELFNRDVDAIPAEVWLESRDTAIMTAKSLSAIGVTKQLCNRLLEPFMWHTVIVTATEWENFFHLRSPQYMFHNENVEFNFRSKKDAIKNFGENEKVEYPNGSVLLKDLTDLQWLKLNRGQAEIHAMALAEAMWDAYNESNPKKLAEGEWHIPFGDKIDQSRLCIIPSYSPKISLESMTIKVATARCARISYLNFEGKDDYEADINLHDTLLASGHMSPFEHCAKVPTLDDKAQDWYTAEGWVGNFKGFVQYRKTIPGENVQ